MNTNNRKITRAGIVLGVGFAGFFDSFMLHMILQWHHMLSNVIPPDSMENMHRLMMTDGMFDAVTFLIILTGVFLFGTQLINRWLSRRCRRLSDNYYSVSDCSI